MNAEPHTRSVVRACVALFGLNQTDGEDWDDFMARVESELRRIVDTPVPPCDETCKRP